MVQQISRGKNAFDDYQLNKPLQSAKTLGKKVLNFVLPQDEQQKKINDEAKQLKIEKQTKQAELLQQGLTPDELNTKTAELETLYSEKIANLAGNDNVAKNLDGSNYRSINIPYVRPLEESDLNLSIPETLLEFHDAVTKTMKLREFEPNIALLKSLIEGDTKFNQDKIRKVLKVTSKGNILFNNKLVVQKEDAQNRLNKQLKHFIDNVVYGEGEDKAAVNIFGIRQLDLNRFGQNLSFLTATNTMAGNITAGISNVMMGEVNSFGEAMGKKHWTPQNYAKAKGQYLSSMDQFFSDITNLKKSKITQLGIWCDAIQGEFRDNNGKKIVGSVIQRMATTNSLFFLTHGGEHEIQLTAMLSLMDNTKVQMKDGTTASLFDAFEQSKDGYFRISKDANWTDQDTKNFQNRLHGINEYLNGLYSQFNKAYIQRKWYGKAALIFRKHMYNALKARWGNGYYDRQIQSKQTGFYRDFFTKLATDIRDYKLDGVKNLFTREGWSDDQKYAYNRTVFELGLFASTCIVGIAIARAESDDKKEKPWGQEYLALLMLRLRADLGQSNMVGTVPDMVNIVKNPSVLVGTVGKFGSFFTQLISDPFAEYKKKTGYFSKGDSVLYGKASKLIPFYNQFIKLMTPKEQQQFYSLLQQGY